MRIFDLPPGDLSKSATVLFCSMTLIMLHFSVHNLVNMFFESHAPGLLLFHQPTFRSNMNQGLHFREPAFAAVVLLVCAIMSRFSDDPIVLHTGSWYSSGYRWYLQAKNHYTPSKAAPSLHDVQMYTLMCIYLNGSSSPQTAWTACAPSCRYISALSNGLL